MTPLAGKVALITGASRGIGREIAWVLAGAGADCVVTATTQEGADRVGREMTAQGRQALAVACDVSRPADVDRLVSEIDRVFGRVDLLVNNAGIVHRAPLAEVADADFERVVAVNLLGPFYLARRLIPGMAKRGHGRVINVSSISATLACPGNLAYGASKWGLNGLTRGLAEEVKHNGVFVAAVMPGSVDTDMLRGSGFTPEMTPSDVASVVRYLCAEAPMAMTGSLVEVFG